MLRSVLVQSAGGRGASSLLGAQLRAVNLTVGFIARPPAQRGGHFLLAENTRQRTEPQCSTHRKFDWLLWGGGAVTTVAYIWHLVGNTSAVHSRLGHFTHGAYELINTMWWGVLLGIIFVGLLDRVPREIIIAALAGERRSTGILRATAAGVLFDLCSHGILMVGMKLYERGATLGQTVAFLLASPWNSLSLTIVLVALIGWWYTILFVVLSAIIAIITGYLFDTLVDAGRLPNNPARECSNVPDQVSINEAVRQWLAKLEISWKGSLGILTQGLLGSRMVLRWLLFGVVLASGIRAFVPTEIFSDWFGPTLLGVVATVLVATIVEVCSEGATPLAADLVTRAAAPGNGFIFLMAGVATDYTEIMSLKDTTGSWRIALMLPVIAVPQTLLVGIAINLLA